MYGFTKYHISIFILYNISALNLVYVFAHATAPGRCCVSRGAAAAAAAAAAWQL